MPAVAITNVVPTLTTVRIETFSASCWKFDLVPNLPGASTENTSIVTTRKKNVIRTGLVIRRRHSGGRGVDGHAGALGRAGTSGTASPASGRVDRCELGLRRSPDRVRRVVLDVTHAATSFV